MMDASFTRRRNLKGNVLTTLSPATFTNQQQLTTLCVVLLTCLPVRWSCSDLSFNLLTALPAELFAPLIALTILCVDHITRLHHPAPAI